MEETVEERVEERMVYTIRKDGRIENIYTADAAIRKYKWLTNLECLKHELCQGLFIGGYEFKRITSEEEHEAAWDEYLEQY